LTEADLAARLRRYEQLLKTHGVKLEDDEVNNEPTVPPDYDEGSGSHALGMNGPRPRNQTKGALFADRENSHYVEKYDNLPSTPRLLTFIVPYGRI